MAKLSAVQVRKAGPGVYSDGLGLILRVKESGARSWVLRVQVNGRRRDIGLGSDADLSLLEAREKAANLRKIARQGKDPIAERDREKVSVPTFARAVDLAHENYKAGWGDKTAEQFLASMKQHAVPVIGALRVDSIGLEQVLKVLAPIWTTKPEIARKVRHRLRKVLVFANSQGWRSERVPAPDEISDGLAKQPVGAGFAAMHYAEVPAFFAAQLAKQESPARLALLFTILTACRSGEVRNGSWAQVDRKAKVWRRDAAFMKARRSHDVPLSPAALAVLDRAAALFGSEGPPIPEGARWAAARPSFFTHAKVPLTIVCGPPGSGKSTFVRANAAERHQVICFDLVARDIFPGRSGDARTRVSLSDQERLQVMRRRNYLLWQLMEPAAQPACDQAWLIVSEPLAENRLWWWRATGADVITLPVPAEICRARIAADAARGDERGRQATAYVDQWWAEYSPAACDRTVGNC